MEETYWWLRWDSRLVAFLDPIAKASIIQELPVDRRNGVFAVITESLWYVWLLYLVYLPRVCLSLVRWKICILEHNVLFPYQKLSSAIVNLDSMIFITCKHKL